MEKETKSTLQKIESGTFCIRGCWLAYLVALLIFFSTGCREEVETPSLPDLDTYLERFEQEAAKRGYDFDLSVVEAVFKEKIQFGDNAYCGYGYSNYQGFGRRRIEIATEEGCDWLSRTDIERENLFFHEIGHAFLNRSHDESRLCDGSPLSVMSSTSNIWKTYSETKVEKRDYYISELIDKMAAVDQCIDYEKGWINDSIYYRYAYADDKWVFDSRDGLYIGNTIDANHPSNDAISIELIPGRVTDLGGRWYRRIDNPNIPECADVTLKVTMNSEGLNGAGAAISIRAFHAPVGKNGAASEEYLYVTTTEDPVAGKLENYVEELTIPCYSRKTTFIVLFLRLMGGTEGKVTFEDIELVVKEK